MKPCCIAPEPLPSGDILQYVAPRNTGVRASGDILQYVAAELGRAWAELQRGDCRDGALERVEVLVVVVPRHRGRFVTDNALHDVKRNTCIRRERDKRVPERVEGRLGRAMLAPFQLHARLNVRCLENPRKLLRNLPPRLIA